MKRSGIIRSREVQLPPACYGAHWNNLLRSYYLAPEHPAKLRLLRWLETLSGTRRIVCPTLHGFKMALDQADFVQRTIFYEMQYEPELTELLLSEFNDRDVFYDVGANVGYYTCLAAAAGVKTAYAFEPDPLSCSILKLNLSLNGFEGRCRLCPVALGDENATQLFYRSHVLNTGMSGFVARNAVSAFEIEVQTLTSVVAGAEDGPSILKIDVEGHELAVLQGAHPLLERCPPRLIVFEGSRDLLSSEAHPITSSLHSLGYEVTHIPRCSGSVENVENYVARRQI